MSVVCIQKGSVYTASYPNEGYLYFYRSDLAPGQGKGIIALHGRGGTSLQYAPYYNKLGIGYFAHLLALEGYRVMAIDDMGGTDWGAQASTDRINDAITWLQSTGAAAAGKVGIMGWSMGGIAALNWIDQNPSKLGAAWLWAPASNLSWAHSQATWTAEIETAYGGAAAYAANAVGNDPSATPQNYRGIAPIKLAHATDDATIPSTQTDSFVAAVNDPLVTNRTIATGGHTNLFSSVSDLEVVQHYAQF